jgi:hypothetical protein
VLAVGSLAWWLQMRPALAVDPAPLANLPRQVGMWRSVDLPLDSAVESILRADFNLQRAYVPGRDAAHDPVWLYIGYYGTQRGGRPEHTPARLLHGGGLGHRRGADRRAEDGSGRYLNE